MPFSATGIFTPAVTFVPDSPATAADQNTQDVDMAQGFTDCLTRDGLAPATNNISFGGFQINELGAGVAPTDAATVSQAGSTGMIGELRAKAGMTIPAKWLLCFGQAVSRTTYAALFAEIGIAWGAGDTTTTFNVPDFRGRGWAGVDNMGGTAASRVTLAVAGFDGTVLGAAGGDQNYAEHDHGLTDPTHNHGITDPAHQHLWGNGANGGTLGAGSVDATFINSGVSTLNTNPSVTGITVNNAPTNITVNNAGTGLGANMQPTAMVNIIIYAGV
jgi:microcystin-dependent protein